MCYNKKQNQLSVSEFMAQKHVPFVYDYQKANSLLLWIPGQRRQYCLAESPINLTRYFRPLHA